MSSRCRAWSTITSELLRLGPSPPRRSVRSLRALRRGNHAGRYLAFARRQPPRRLSCRLLVRTVGLTTFQLTQMCQALLDWRLCLFWNVSWAPWISSACRHREPWSLVPAILLTNMLLATFVSSWLRMASTCSKSSRKEPAVVDAENPTPCDGRATYRGGHSRFSGSYSYSPCWISRRRHRIALMNVGC